MEELVKLQGVTKTFKDFWGKPKAVAIKNLSFSVERGEILGLLGPNGSGKSTTLKLMLGLLYPTRGRISVFGKHPGDNIAKQFIGYLPEEDYLYSYLNGRETLDFYGKIFSLPSKARRERIDFLIDLLGIKAYQRRSVGEYSKGMARRIGLAQALINDPELLILDEPTNGMDPIGIKEMKDLFLDLKSKGKTMVISTHLLSDIETICDRVGILYQGEFIAMDRVDKLLLPYHNESHCLEKFFLDKVYAEREKREEKRKTEFSKEKAVPAKKPDEVDQEVIRKLLHKE
ncbi:MAG: ABC transporter ATP-binding protein [Candidatus Ratteibacteria bacterium]|nr:ABC transporter ATP-binding protein [Candidatus Ratteibacteria bacterium]